MLIGRFQASHYCGPHLAAIASERRATLSRLGIYDFSVHISVSYRYRYNRSKTDLVRAHRKLLNQIVLAMEKWVGCSTECNLI